ncbi:hypothetical protein [Pseudoalteromonas luteoviolacea]|uniref:Lipoprotein n=1 Tax=Pseudoalteromonas luteoviolacea (strain 2ta16) TaxID=1353533 RepID=V4JED1_PSEL2|nr:hypothetical protein [Pseudoalteromonas luteoviolacea]ESP93382.1 hypothetical protein PL2TA16_03235 [Pseudoalteromonas luteoviolacea 2ta16]KZN33596.1 hypothetical protein N483_26125 [Pseudoalteromonas luteoviolacea NCIMB 1944]
MNLSGLFKVSLISSALVLAGCGGDINITPTNNDNHVDNSVENPVVVPDTGNDDNDKPVELPCASYTIDGTTFEGDQDGTHCKYSQAFASNAKNITSSFLLEALPDGGAHIFEGALFIGDDVQTSEGETVDPNGPTLTIEAGATIAFTKAENFVRIGRGSKIHAVGELGKPITFTSIKEIDGDDTTVPAMQDWGGIQINGMARTESCSKTAADEGKCDAKAEGVISYYGGNNDADNSGSLEHVVVKFAGNGVEGDELNSITLNAVGSGTKIEYIHIHQGYDDGIELFGGQVNLKHIVVTETADDGIDWDTGWKGNGQFILVQTLTQGNHGFETDGGKDDPTTADKATTVSNPTIANATVVSNGIKGPRGHGAGMEMKEWGKAQLHNMLFVSKGTEDGSGCFDLMNKNDLSGAAGIHANAKNGEIKFHNSIFACAKNFESTKVPLEGDLADFNIETWFTNDGNKLIGFNSFSNVLGDDLATTKGTILDKDGNAIEAVETSKLSDENSFFTDVTYVGALGEDETDTNWAKFVAESIARTK